MLQCDFFYEHQVVLHVGNIHFKMREIKCLYISWPINHLSWQNDIVNTLMEQSWWFIGTDVQEDW